MNLQYLPLLALVFGVLVWSIMAAVGSKKTKKKSWGGYYGYQVAGKEFHDQTSKPNNTYLSDWLVNMFGWSASEAVGFMKDLSEEGKLTSESLSELGVVLFSKDRKEKYHFQKVSDATWQVTMLMDKPLKGKN